jgi:hypothetical protein
LVHCVTSINDLIGKKTELQEHWWSGWAEWGEKAKVQRVKWWKWRHHGRSPKVFSRVWPWERALRTLYDLLFSKL